MIAHQEILSYYAMPGLKDRPRLVVKKLLDKQRMNDILDIVSDVTGISKYEIIGKSRKVENVVARQIFCKICNMYIKVSLSDIGMFLRNRNHTTVIHSIKAINGIIDTDPAVKMLFKIVQNRVY